MPRQGARLQEAERSPALMLDALDHGRVLADRDEVWPRLCAGERRWQRRVAEQESLEDSFQDLEL
jgi:hypothetical protein